jgi:hypothetical protein
MKGTYIGAIKPLSLFFVKLGGSFSLITHNTNMSNVQTKHSSVGFFFGRTYHLFDGGFVFTTNYFFNGKRYTC